jgi:hypothetical protein
LSFVYFTDRDLGKRFAEILRAGALTVERHADHFADDAADETWLEEIGKRGWIVLTRDRRIRYKPNELDAVVRHGVGLLVIVGKAPLSDLARAFVATLPRVENFLNRRKPPFAEVSLRKCVAYSILERTSINRRNKSAGKTRRHLTHCEDLDTKGARPSRLEKRAARSGRRQKAAATG